MISMLGEAVGKKFSYVIGDVEKVVAEGNELHVFISDGPRADVPRHEVMEFKSADSMAKEMRHFSDHYIPIFDSDGNRIDR
jgi:hypothetical protein